MRCEGSKRNRHQSHVSRLITYGNNSRIGIGDATRLILDFRDVVDDEFLRLILVSAHIVQRTDDVNLIVLEVEIALVDVNHVVVVVYSKAEGEKFLIRKFNLGEIDQQFMKKFFNQNLRLNFLNTLKLRFGTFLIFE